MTAVAAHYHLPCLTSFYREGEAALTCDNSEREKQAELHCLAFAALVSYIELSNDNSKVTPVFKLEDLVKMDAN